MTTSPNPDVRASTLDSSALLARMPEASLYNFEVVERIRLTPAMNRIRVTADNLEALSYVPGQDFMLSVPTEVNGEPQHFRRRYTIRQFHREAKLLDLDIVVHGDGPGARWASTVSPGDHIEAIGPRGKVTVNPEAQWHLFCGDESALPATYAMVESLPKGSQAVVILEVDGSDDEQVLSTPEYVEVEQRWLHRGSNEAGTGSALVDAVRAVHLPSTPAHAYLNGELTVVSELRAALIDLGLESSQISMKPYWRRGVSNASHGEPERA